MVLSSAPLTMKRTRLALPLGLLLASLGCQKVIGDSCTISSDCSFQGDRFCDTSQPEGYCTIVQCDPDTCPDEAVCVAFDAHVSRLTRRYCMAGCEADEDCRTPLYRCVRPDPPACVRGGASVASCNVIEDRNPPSPGWCVQVATPASGP